MTARRVTTAVDAPADDLFALLTDLGRLPEWNDIIIRVDEDPAALVPGAEWVVTLRALGQSWQSRSTVVEYHPDRRHFAYRSQTDDGNPSWAEWTWTVTAIDDDRAEVTVAWDVHPVTFWRRVLLARIRDRQLRRHEVPGSIRALAALAAPIGERGRATP